MNDLDLRIVNNKKLLFSIQWSYMGYNCYEIEEQFEIT